MSPAVPHPIPYQGSKRQIAARIVAFVPAGTRRLVEPFAGSGAVTLAVASRGLASSFLLGDSLEPLVGLWRAILSEPAGLARSYAALWHAQAGRERAYYDEVRAAFNRDGDPARLLFLLARCVKGAVRFNHAGQFNQAPDNRRRGARPELVGARILGAHRLLAGRASARAADYAELLHDAAPTDLVYMDPPYLGVSGTRDARYHQGLDLERFTAELDRANARGLRYLVSFDGRSGERTYGPALPAALDLRRVEVPAGRSAQATLSGRVAHTVESLYLSPGLRKALLLD